MDPERERDRDRYARLLDRATPAGMIRDATAARLAGDWRAACAAAGVDVHLDLREVAGTFGVDAAAMIEADLAGLAPDYLRRHLPRLEGLAFEPGVLAVLSRWPLPLRDPGRRAGTPILAVSLPAGPDRRQRLHLRVIGSGSLPERWLDLPDWAWHAGAVAERRWAYGASASRLPWHPADPTRPSPDPDRASEFEQLLAATDLAGVADRYRSAGVVVEQRDRQDWIPHALLRMHDRLPLLVAEARRLEYRYGELVRDRATGEVALPAAGWYSPGLVVRADGSVAVAGGVWSTPATRGGPVAFGVAAPLDAALLRWGLLGPDELHPLAHEALFPGRAQDWRPVLHDPFTILRVRCGGEWHLVEVAGARLSTPRHGEAADGTAIGCAAARAAFRTGKKPVPKEIRKLRQRIFARAFHGDTDAVLTDLAAGLDPALRDGRGRSLLHLVGYLDHERVLPALLTAGLSLDERDAEGRTPLHVAALAGAEGAMAALIAAGADPEARDPDGLTASDVLSGHAAAEAHRNARR